MTVDIESHFVATASPVDTYRSGVGGHPCQGIYYRPAGARPTTAFIATHYNVDFSEHYLARHLAERGFGFLGWNTRFRGQESHFILDHALVEIGVGVQWLRDAGVERVVLIGNSGGGSLMAAYHSQSREPSIRPARGRELLPEVLRLPPADLFIFVAAHPGRPEILTDWMDPSVVDENDPMAGDPDLDMYDPRNGPPYSEEFIARYRRAQVARNDRLTDWCIKRLVELEGEGLSDQLFVMRRTSADLRYLDATIDPSPRKTPWCYFGDPKAANYGVYGIGQVNTLRTWLNMWSLRESDCRAAPHLARLDVPTLQIHPESDAGIFPSQAAAIFDGIAAEDKQFVALPGGHYFEGPPEYRVAVAECIVNWLRARDVRP